jgi:hypothetical protein
MKRVIIPNRFPKPLLPGFSLAPALRPEPYAHSGHNGAHMFWYGIGLEKVPTAGR